MAQVKLTKIQHGLEAVSGTLVPATFKWPGLGTLTFDDKVEQPEYSEGFAGGTVESTFISSTGATLNLNDTDCSVELLIWALNAAVKSVPGPIISPATFGFTFPSTAVNAIGSYTFEVGTSSQEYEFGYGFFESFSIHGDHAADNGRIKFNGVVKGQKVAASTVTAALNPIPSHEPLNIANATIHFDTAGTAAGTAAKTSAYLKAFSVDVKTGFYPGVYADGRAAKDFAQADGGGIDYEITGTIKAVLGATAVTEIANARAGTSRMVALKLNGTSSRLALVALPLIYTAAPDIGTEQADGMHLCSFPFAAKYSRTTAAQAPSITITATGTITVT